MIENVLDELDAPCEYFIDVDAAQISWMPPAGGVAATREVALSVAGAIVVGSALANAAFDGLELLYARSTGLAASSAVNVTVRGCTSALHGHTGIELDGVGLTLRDSSVSETGCRATSVSGGDLATLTRSNNVVANNSMTRFARITRTYNPGIAFGGVGGVYTDNVISDAPHTGITGGGALHTFERNVLDGLLFEASDAGAFYVGYSWTNRGNVVRNNTFRRIRAREKTSLGYPSVQALYLDDEHAGYVVEGNLCEDSMTCFFVGGGRDVIVRDNVCRNVGTCLHLDDRGLNWQHDSCVVNATWTGRLVQELLDVDYTRAPYATAFPEIVTTLARAPCTPTNVSFLRNAACNATTLIDVTAQDLQAWGDTFEGNTAVAVCT